MDALHAWAWRPDGPAPAMADGPLSGFVLGVKDVIDVAGMPTRCGSPLTAPDPAAADAPAVARLRAAGAVIAGKTRCTEWALNDPAPTISPFDADRTPGGSSAGSAVAVATGGCTATLDTQTAGDVVRPAAYNGVVGLKPTAGWATTAGGRAVAPSIDTLGVLARHVRDAAAVAAAIADGPALFAPPGRAAAPRIGVLRDPFTDRVGDAVRACLARAVRAFSAAGADVHDVSTGVDLAAVHAAHRVITFAECASLHRRRYRDHAERYGPRARELIERGLGTPARDLQEAGAVRRDAAERLGSLLEGLDALLVPAVPEPAPPRATTGDSRLQIPWTLCGLPSLALPAGTAGPLPLGVQLVAARNAEPELIAAAAWCERVLGS
ncbi:amidase [Actinomadura montaniterrae]|uniref:Amidase n=1 Tax=Actinomadura montaniterrae TaxID=1803903 RepID=A0A6L3VXQ5_9ACTN|nr:amidase [Actinomadura montaniterrae]KAB2376104.1 amidase [Actinomadura montaniterrae]